MATSRKLIDTSTDWGAPGTVETPGEKLGYPGKPFSPYVYYNGEELPTGLVPTNSGSAQDRIEYGGTPSYVDGIRGKAHKFNGVASEYMRFANWYLPVNMDTEAWMVAFYFTPSSTTAQFQGLVTSRGDGYGTDRGFHLAMAGARLNLRAYSGAGSFDIATDPSYNGQSVGQNFYTLSVGTTYHIVLKVDPTKTNKYEVYVNGILRLFSTNWIKPGGNERSITIGNFLVAPNYPAYGTIDEVLFFVGNSTTPSIDDMKAYDTYLRNILKPGRVLDYYTEPGSIQLKKKDDGTYFTGGAVTWESGVIDIGEPPVDYYARLHMNAVFNPANHAITLATQSSDDGITFSAWQDTGSDGTIYSPNKRYYKFRASLSTTSNTSTPVLKSLEMLEYARPIEYDLVSEPLRVYADLDTGLTSMGILNNAYDIEIEEEVKAKDLLTFKLPMNDPKRRSLGAEAVEFLIRLGDRRYILKENKDKKDTGGKKISDFKAEAKWYELNDVKHPDYELIEGTITDHVNKILGEGIPSTGWILGNNLSTKGQKRTIRGKWKSALQLLREVESTFGVELKFYYDVSNDQDYVDVVDQLGSDKKIRFYYNKNITEIERTIDTYGMVTRLYLYGAGELDITTVNGGVPYIENFEWVNKLGLKNKIRPDQWSDDRYTVPLNLLEDGTTLLEQMSKPNITYAMGLRDLSSRSGHEPESVELGDTVYPIDEDLMIDYLPSRVMRRKYNVREPHKSEVELDQPKKELADAQSRAFDDEVQVLTESDPISNSDIQEMTVFNQLLNSRADDGLAEWTIESGGGITASTDGGFSGENSFKIESGYGEYNAISQEVFNVSHRSTYTISAMVNKTGNITAGGNGFVGIRVKVRYKPIDGAPAKEEIKFLKIPDVTNMP